MLTRVVNRCIAEGAPVYVEERPMKTEAEIMRSAARWLLDNGYLDDNHSDDCDRSGDRDCCEARKCLARLLNDPDVAGSAAREAETFLKLEG